MVVTQIGDHTTSAQNLVVVGYKREYEHVPIHRLLMLDRTAVEWDPTTPPGNATISNAKVREITVIGVIRYCAL